MRCDMPQSTTTRTPPSPPSLHGAVMSSRTTRLIASRSCRVALFAQCSVEFGSRVSRAAVFAARRRSRLRARRSCHVCFDRYDAGAGVGAGAAAASAAAASRDGGYSGAAGEDQRPPMARACRGAWTLDRVRCSLPLLRRPTNTRFRRQHSARSARSKFANQTTDNDARATPHAVAARSPSWWTTTTCTTTTTSRTTTTASTSRTTRTSATRRSRARPRPPRPPPPRTRMRDRRRRRRASSPPRPRRR